MKRVSIIILGISLLVLLVSCGNGMNEGENYGDLLSSPEGLILTPEEHRGGWGRADCFFCHPIHNLHLVNSTSFPDIDMEEVRYITIIEGEASCPTCHGYNGLF